MVLLTVTRPPLNFASAAPHIDNNVLGITSGESLGGVDNITSIGVGNTTLGTYERIGGNTYHTSAPTVTIVHQQQELLQLQKFLLQIIQLL